MSVITPILEEYRILEEKIVWFISYLEHVTMINSRTAEIYFRCTQVPRNTRWQDVNIINIVDAMDKTRESCEKFTKTCEDTLTIECDEILQRVKAQICYLSELEINFNVSLEKYLEDLMECRKNHLNAWEKQDKDVWFTEHALKFSLKKYIEKSEQWDDDLKKELVLLDRSLFEIGETFVGIINSSQVLLKNQNLILANIHHQTIIEQRRFQKDYFFDFPENEEVDQVKYEEKRKIKFEDEFDQMINDLRSNNENITKEIGTRKYGIFKVKKGYDTKLALVIVTETRYVHAFDIESVIIDQKISDEQKITLKKLNDLKKGSSFFSFKNEMIDQDDVDNLLDFRDYVYNHLDVRKHCLKGFPFRVKNKLVRFEKSRKEITITEKKQATFKSLFISNCVKIKSFVEKDIFELFWAVCNKTSEIKYESSESRESLEPINKIEVENPIENSTENDDDNPWKTEENTEIKNEF